MKYIFTILLFILTHKSYAQLDNVHYLQPMTSLNTGGITQEFLYLSTPSTDLITVKITFPDEITSPRIAVGNALGQNETVITNGTVTLSNTSPIRIRFLTSTGTTAHTPLKGNSPITPSRAYVNRVIKSNENIGLVLKSEHRFYANYRGRSTNQAGSMLSKGQAALGKQFFWLGLPTEVTPGSSTVSNTSINKVLSIMATEDNTTVTLSGYDNGLQFLTYTSVTTLGTTHTINLNKGESYIYVVPVDTSARRDMVI
ncbi:IgGFc-binding protein [Faecalibacter bovis]|uniref:IgGFc-binding protein N-terminal domain-containing protein n=1 Tax=Faecalibacter bovis TaxID=2898187 RepID=A0ABX7XFK5_9FLAO|nr:IgGFc-binding protein [Faecalibacter bovis]QTV06379.1 hypothetical protein J9309_03350 [Faecalibacter bovis]